MAAAATFFSAASIRALVAGSFSVPVRALKTSWSVSPLAAGKCCGEQVVGALALGPGQAEARDLLDADARRDDLDDDEREQPGEERPPPVAVADAGETDEARALDEAAGEVEGTRRC